MRVLHFSQYLKKCSCSKFFGPRSTLRELRRASTRPRQSCHDHGRGDAAVSCGYNDDVSLFDVFCEQVVLTFLFSLSARLPVGVLIFAICIGAVVNVYSHLMYLPYYHQLINQTAVACASVFSWAAFCLVLAYLRDQPEVRTC